MKTHTTNYQNTFITVAEDSKTTKGTVPPTRGKNKTIAQLQYEILKSNPYQFTSDDILFQVYAYRNNVTQAEYEQARKNFFSTGKPCFRASPLTKRYGFGIHNNHEGKIALYGMETEEYQSFLVDNQIKKVKAMRSKRK